MSASLSESSKCLYSLDLAQFFMAAFSSICYSLSSAFAFAIFYSSMVILALYIWFYSCKFSLIYVGESGLSKSNSATLIGENEISLSSIWRMVVDSLFLAFVDEGTLLGSEYGTPIDPSYGKVLIEFWRRVWKEALFYCLTFTELRLERLSPFDCCSFTELRFEKLFSLSRKLERTAISIKSRSLSWKVLVFWIGPPSGAGLRRGNLSVIYLDLQYLLILNSVSAMIDVLSWLILTWRYDYTRASI